MRKILVAALAVAALAARADIVVQDGETIAFMGDSITYFGNNSPVGYVNLVMRGLEVAGVKDVKKIPAGIAGHKSDDMLGRLDGDVLARKDGRRAQWMTFSCGVNDVMHGERGIPFEGYTNNVSKTLDKCAAAGVKVIVLTPTMIGEVATNANNVKLARYVAWEKAEAARRNLICADLNAAMRAELAALGGLTWNALTVDGVHMRYEGDRVMAWGVLAAMGVPAEKKAEIFAAWDEMPGYKKASVLLNRLEAEDFQRRLKAENLDEDAYLRKLLGYGKK